MVAGHAADKDGSNPFDEGGFLPPVGQRVERLRTGV